MRLAFALAWLIALPVLGGVGCGATPLAEPEEDIGHASLHGRCDDEKEGLCVGSANLYFAGQFPKGWRHPLTESPTDPLNLVADREWICPSGVTMRDERCRRSSSGAFETLDSFAKWVKDTNLTIVSMQETVGLDAVKDSSSSMLPARLGKEWSVACRGHVLYRSDRVRAEELPAPPEAPKQLRSLCAMRVAKVAALKNEVVFVGGGLDAAEDGEGDPGRSMATWIESLSSGRPVLVGVDLEGSAPGDGAAPVNPKRRAAMVAAGFEDAFHRDTVVGPPDRTLDYLFVKGGQHAPRTATTWGYLSGGSDHVWIWSKVLSMGLDGPVAGPGPSPPTTPLHRYFSASGTDHFYTVDRDDLGYGGFGYAYEGTEGNVFPSQAPGTVPLYRMYNAGNQDHFYTTSDAERSSAEGFGYAFERVEGYAFGTAVPGTVALHRYWNGDVGDHFYTLGRDDTGLGAVGYVYEGVAAWVSP